MTQSPHAGPRIVQPSQSTCKVAMWHSLHPSTDNSPAGRRAVSVCQPSGTLMTWPPGATEPVVT